MPRRKNTYSASHMRRTSRQVHDSTIGTHVTRRAPSSYNSRSRHASSMNHRSPSRVENIARRARLRRFIIGAIAVIIVAGLAIGAGFLAFRGAVGGEFALKDSDARDALVSVKSDQPTYTLITAELGAVATPLETEGPDVILLARLDANANSFTLVNLPSSLQITSDNKSESLGALATKGDAALIQAVASLAKIDISHFVKVDQAGLTGIIDAFGGVPIDLEQIIDDPQAGSVYLKAGQQTLDAQAALTYLRATNVKYGSEDRLTHQLRFAAQLFQQLFSKEGAFDQRLESIGSYFQTDYSLGDLEAINKWMAGKGAGDIVCTIAPGYFTAVTNVTSTTGERFVITQADMVKLIDDLDNGREVSSGRLEDITAAQAGSFTLDIQNGTTIVGAAGAASEALKAKGFTIGDVGNAEQPVYDETLVVYKDGAEGQARAKAVIDALGAGRAVESSSYYSFAHDVLLIIGADNKPVS